MQKKKLNELSNLLPNLLLSIFLVSCASKVPDVAVCTRLNATQGYCVNTISNKEGVIDDNNTLDGKTWLDIVIESVYVPVDSWKEIKLYIIKMCKLHKDCHKDIASWDRKIQQIDETLPTVIKVTPRDSPPSLK